MNKDIIFLKAEIDKLSNDESRTQEALFKNLDALGDLHFIYHNCTTLQKHQLLNTVFDRNLFYYQSVYRTPTLLPVFHHNLLILKEKRLLEG